MKQHSNQQTKTSTLINKTRIKQLLYGLELRVTAIIANGLIHKTPKRIVLNQIKSELLVTNKHIHLNSREIRRLYKSFRARYIKLLRNTFSSLKRADLGKKEDKKSESYLAKLEKRQDILYEEMKKTVLTVLKKNRNVMANTLEKRNKKEYLEDLLSEGIFYLCSSHEHPARGHKDYEGKIYVSEDWENRAETDRYDEIRDYIAKNGIKTVEWVIGEPVYMTTRPNCKHYFMSLTVDEVLGTVPKKLLQDYKMIMPDEKVMSKEYLTYKNYYEDLKALVYLKRMCPSRKINEDIRRTRNLTRQWKIKADIARA